MAQWLRTLVAFAEDQGSIPMIHMVAHSLIYNSTSRGSNAFSDQDFFGHQAHMWNTHTHIHTHTYMQAKQSYT